MTLFLLHYVTNSYGAFGFDELETRVFLTRDEVHNFILQLAKQEYPDENPDVFKSLEALENFLDRLHNDDQPILMFEILEINSKS